MKEKFSNYDLWLKAAELIGWVQLEEDILVVTCSETGMNLGEFDYKKSEGWLLTPDEETDNRTNSP